MTPQLQLLDHTTVVVSASQLEIIRTCPKMWLYKHLCRRVEVVPDAATKGGHALDQAFNWRYQKLGSAAVDPATEAEMEAIIDEAYKDVELPLEEFRTPARYKEVIRAYNAHWGAEPFKVLGVQVPFAVELGEVSVSYEFWRGQAVVIAEQGKLVEAAGFTNKAGTLCGLCDGTSEHIHPQLTCTACGQTGLAENMPKHNCAGNLFAELTERTSVKVVLHGILDLYVQLGEHVIVMDTKTSKSDIGGSYSNSTQMMLYMWAMQELARINPASGLPPRVHAVIINGVTIRPPYKQEGRTPKPTDKPRNSFMRTFPEFYSQERLEECRRDTLRWVQTALGWVADNHYPSNTKHCTFHQEASFINYGWFGKNCPYLPICQLPMEQRLAMLESDAYMDYKRGPLSESKESAPA